MSEFGAFGRLPFVFHGRMSAYPGYVRRVALVLSFRPNCYSLMVSYGFGLDSLHAEDYEPSACST